MATLTNCILEITPVADQKKVQLKVQYTLTPNQTEKLAGTVFGGTVQIRQDDPGTGQDNILTTISDSQFAVSTSTSSITRKLNAVVVPKSLLNEDTGFGLEGEQQVDEVFARAVVTYKANAPTPLPVITPADSIVHRGAWTA